MSSTFSMMPSRYNQKSLLGSSKPQPVWLQFVPGIVMDVVINDESPGYQSDRDINSIIAKSHITPKSGLKLKQVSKKRYYPLFRGMVDTPVKGDQVLLCTFGGVEYYMGPINTVNSPNWNIDHLNLQDSSELAQVAPSVPGAKGLNKYGLSSTFKATDQIKRIQKKFNKELDDSLDTFKVDKMMETHGDMVFEGRHGNSMRLGSRDMNPYILFSNGRMLNNDHESMFDGSLMLFSTEGTLHQHFPDDIIQEEEDTEPVPLLFTLSSDTIGVNKEEGQKRMVGALDTEDSESKGLYDYTYDGPQLFLNSDKITINSRQQSMFLSSFQNIIISSGIKLEFVSENETIFEASNIYLGRQSRDKKVSGESPAEPLVLGEQLRLFLTEMVEILETAHGLCQGAPIPVMDSSGAPLLPKWLQLKQKIADVDTAPFNSQYHFIEDNGNKT